jgi:uncharacterized membrane protein YfcA
VDILTFIFVLFTLGFVAGFLAALSSTSPSLLMVPALTAIYFAKNYTGDLPTKLAIVNSLATSCAVFATCTFRHFRLGHFQEGKAILLFCGAIVGALAGVQLESALDNRLIMGVVAVSLIVVGVSVVQRPDRYAKIFEKLALPTKTNEGPSGKLELFGIGLAAGLFSGSTGIGCGLIAIPLQFFFGMPVLAAIHNASLATAFSSFTALMGYLFFDTTLGPVFSSVGADELLHLSILAAAGMIGARLGVSVSNSKYRDRMRFFIGPLYVLVGLTILLEGKLLMAE